MGNDHPKKRTCNDTVCSGISVRTTPGGNDQDSLLGCMMPVVHYSRNGDQCCTKERYDRNPCLHGVSTLIKKVQLASKV